MVRCPQELNPSCLVGFNDRPARRAISGHGGVTLRLSTRGRYGVAALYELATRSDGPPVTLRQIAEGQGLSESYLEQLFLLLRRADVVRSIRGAQGGYVLARPAESITIGDIVRAVEGPIAPVACVAGDEDCARHDLNGCPTRPIWVKLAQCMNRVLDSITLADIARAEPGEVSLEPCHMCTTRQGGVTRPHE